MRLAKVLAVVFGILTIFGAAYGIWTGGRAGSGYAVIPMLFCLIFSQWARSKETKYRKTVLTIIFILVLFTVGVVTASVVTYERKITSVLKQYLYVEKRYSVTEVKEINVSYHLGRLIFGYDPYVSSVVFSNEPNTIYYFDFRNNKIYPGAMGKRIPVKR